MKSLEARIQRIEQRGVAAHGVMVVVARDEEMAERARAAGYVVVERRTPGTA